MIQLRPSGAENPYISVAVSPSGAVSDPCVTQAREAWAQ
jgi:hypothetical protein